MNPAAFYGLIAWALILGTSATFLPRIGTRWLAAGVALAALLPFLGDDNLAMMLHGMFAAPSFTLVQLALRRLVAPACPKLLCPPAAMLLVAVAAIFYPLALGLGPFDPYALGYQPRALLLALLPLAGWLAWRRQADWLLILGIDLLAYAAGLFGNLWDALFDPLLILVAISGAWQSRRL